MRDDTTTSDGGFDEAVKLFITSDSELKRARSNPFNFERLTGVTCELKNLSSEVLKDGSCVNCSGCTDSAGITDAVLQESVDTADGKLYENKD